MMIIPFPAPVSFHVHNSEFLGRNKAFKEGFKGSHKIFRIHHYEKIVSRIIEDEYIGKDYYYVDLFVGSIF